MSTVKSRNLQGEPGALPDPAVSNRLPASRAVFMGCFHWLGTQTAWCPSPGLPDPSPSPHTGLLGHGEEADRAHHFHRYTRSHKHREDGLCSLAIQEGKQCPMGGGARRFRQLYGGGIRNWVSIRRAIYQAGKKPRAPRLRTTRVERALGLALGEPCCYTDQSGPWETQEVSQALLRKHPD